jgi:uncharacterized membrane protein
MLSFPDFRILHRMDTTTPPPQFTAAPARDPRDVEENKDIAAFSYLWVMSVVIFFVKGKSPFVRYHSRQAILLFVLTLPLWFIPFVGRILVLLVLGLMALGFINAAQGQWKDVPVFGPLSRGEITLRQAWRQIVDAVAGLMSLLHSKVPKASAPDVPPQKSSASAQTAPSASAGTDPYSATPGQTTGPTPPPPAGTPPPPPPTFPVPPSSPQP